MTLDQFFNRLAVIVALVFAVAYVLLYVCFMPFSYFALWLSESATGMESHGFIGWHTWLVTIVYVAGVFHLWNPVTDYFCDQAFAVAARREAKC